MKRRLRIVLIAVLAVAAVSPAAYADHGGAQSPDIEQPDHLCEVRYAGHGACTVSTDTAKRPVAWFSVNGGVPTDDGWRIEFTVKIVDDANNLVLRNETSSVTVPYTWDLEGVPFPAPPGFGLQTGPAGSGGQTTDASCLVDAPNSAGTLRCNFTPGPDDWTLPIGPLP